MTGHVLACALYCNSDGSLNGAGVFAEVVIWFFLGLIALAAVIRGIASVTKSFGPPRKRRR